MAKNQIRINGNNAYFGDVWKMAEIPDGTTDTRLCINWIGQFYYVNRFHAAPGGTVEYLRLPLANITLENDFNTGNNVSIVGLNYNAADDASYVNSYENNGGSSTNINTWNVGYMSRGADNGDFTVIEKNG